MDRYEQEAYDRGLQQGREETIVSEETKLQPLKELLDQSKIVLAEHQSRLRQHMVGDVVQWTTRIAKQLLKHEIGRPPRTDTQYRSPGVETGKWSGSGSIEDQST